ncbi:MAG: SpaA isopeptide-forming pilin-related protein [Acutalibacteraceae bacterium]
MTRKARSHDVLGKLSAFSMAVILLLSVFVPMFASTVEAGAADNSYNGTIYLDLSKNSAMEKQAKSGKLTINNCKVSTVRNAQGLYYTDSTTFTDGTNGLELKYENVTSENADLVGYKRLFYIGNFKHAYFWNGGTTYSGVFPGEEMKKFADGKYYIDYNQDATMVIFNNGTSGSGNQTDDLAISSDKNVYDDSGANGTYNAADWTYTEKKYIKLGDRQNNDSNAIYVDAQGNLRWSRYDHSKTNPYTETASEPLVEVRLYAENWDQANVVYDLNDPYANANVSITTTDTVTVNGTTLKFYKVRVPKNSTFKFYQSNEAAGTKDLTVQDNNDQPLYYNVEKQRWVEASGLAASYDKVVTDTNWAGNSGITGVTATYYDYLSDTEITAGYRNPGEAGNNSNPGWYPFYQFNNYIKGIADSNSTWSIPLYFGNFNSNNNSYNGDFNTVTGALTRFDHTANSSQNFSADNFTTAYAGLVGDKLVNGNLVAADGKTVMPYFDTNALYSATMTSDGTTTDVAKVFRSYFPFRTETNSNGVTTYSFDSGNGKDNVFFDWGSDGNPTKVNYGDGSAYAIQDGIADFNLGSSGIGVFPFNTKGGTDSEFYQIDTINNFALYAYKFPSEKYTDGFKVENKNKTSITTGDILFSNTPMPMVKTADSSFNNDQSGTITGTRKYTQGEIIDGYRYIYVYNEQNWSASDIQIWAWTGTANNGGVTPDSSGSAPYNETALDYGFGVKLEMDFRVPENGTVDGTENGTPVKFEYSGDDDLWLYISDDNGDDNLVLDLGGAHKKSTGSINFKDMSVSRSSVYDNGSKNNNVTTYFNGSSAGNPKRLDPNNTYHMTIFYMERGLIESNLEMSFTTTPVTNDLSIDKTVNVDNVNEGLKNAAQTSDNFTFTTTQASGQKAQDNLTHGQTVSYTEAKNNLVVGEDMTIAETTTSPLNYSTTSYVVDTDATKAIQSSGNDKNLTFKYYNSEKNSGKNTRLFAHFTNTLLTNTLNISKKVVDKTGQTDISDSVGVDFSFNVGISLDNGANYGSYNLEYEVYDKNNTPVPNPATGINSYIATNGDFKLKPGQKAKFTGIPQGAKYKITEKDLLGGFSLFGCEGQGELTGNSIIGQIPTTNDTTVTTTAVNKFEPVVTNLTAKKYVDDILYSGDEFTFTQTLLYHKAPEGETTVDPNTDESKEKYNRIKTDILDGDVIFMGVEYTYVGEYYYSVTESLTTGTEAGKYIMNPAEGSATDGQTTYYAVVNVTDSDGKLVYETKYYSSYDERSHQASDELANGVVFKNRTATKYTDVSFTKQGENSNPLSGAVFTLYTDPACEKQATISDASKEDSGFTNPVTSAESTGLVTFKQLKYEPSAAGNVKATYYFKETKAPNGYQLLTGTFKIEIAADSTYTISYNDTVLDKNEDNSSYVVTNIKQPELPLAGGVGVTMFYVLGALAVVIAGTAFVLYKKRINVIALAAQLIHRK